MVKVTHISKYAEMNDEALQAETLRLRYEIDNPQLRKRDHFMNLLLSILGAGTTVSTAAGLGYMWFNKPEQDPSILSVLDYQDLKKSGSTKELNAFKEKNSNFITALNVTVSAFALATIVSIPIINNIQKKERAEDNATKLSHAERILRERGYELAHHLGDFAKRPTAAEPNVAQNSVDQASNTPQPSHSR